MSYGLYYPARHRRTIPREKAKREKRSGAFSRPWGGVAEVVKPKRLATLSLAGTWVRIPPPPTAEHYIAVCRKGRRAELKHGIYGTFHNVSRKHLHRYVAEFDFRWNARKVDDDARTALAIRSADNKRLRYREPVAKDAQ